MEFQKQEKKRHRKIQWNIILHQQLHVKIVSLWRALVGMVEVYRIFIMVCMALLLVWCFFSCSCYINLASCLIQGPSVNEPSTVQFLIWSSLDSVPVTSPGTWLYLTSGCVPGIPVCFWCLYCATSYLVLVLSSLLSFYSDKC